MTIYAVWYGGANYSEPSIPDDVETFFGVNEAGDALQDRAEVGHVWRQTFAYVNRAPETVLTPNADERPWIRVFKADPSDDTNAEPDYIIVLQSNGNRTVHICGPR